MLRCRSNAADNDFFWSPFTNTTGRTEPDVPYLAPIITDSSFQVQNTQFNRTITLYWKSIPSCYENGKGFQYVVYYHKYYVSPRFKRATYDVVVGNQTSYSFVDMDPLSAYYFKVFAQNTVGISSNSSSIIVDKADNLIHGPIDISVISYGEGKYNISWNNDPQNGDELIKNYTLFWCQNIKPRPFKCEGPVEWMTVSSSNQELSLPDKNINYQFAVAANSEHSTSGLKWASCVVPYRGVLYKVNEVILTPKNSTSIRVHWTLDCNAQKSVVEEYAITYCPIYANHSCSGHSRTVHLNKTSSEQHVITNLEPYTMYRFTVAARTADGWSEDSSVKYEATMSAAPSDPPQNVHLVSINGTLMKISFQPPHKPNGKITQYSVLYGEASSLTNEKHKIDFPVRSSAVTYEAEINRTNVYLYTNYSIQVVACVGMACSHPSNPIYALTEIGAPGPLEPPKLGVINSTLVNITWKFGNRPNGPIDLYQISLLREGDEYGSSINVSGQDNFLSLQVDCEELLSSGLTYYFRIRAINVKDKTLLYGPFSEDTQARLCYLNEGMSYKVLAGVVIGFAAGLAAIMVAVYSLFKWMKKKVDMVKDIDVKLPDGLNSPIDNPLHNSTYSKFKNGLRRDRDNGIPNEMDPDQLFNYMSNQLTKSIDNTLDATTDECLNSASRRNKGGRNQSGDSSLSGKGHDSISSANTNKTLLSIDSGAEMDLPPSPDGIFSDTTSSSNTTPRSYKPDLEIVEETQASSSKDSGLEKEIVNNMPTVISHKDILEQSPQFPYYLRKKGRHYLNPPSFKRAGQMPPYSKFAIVAPVLAPNYVSVGAHNVHLLEQRSLANSEPSVADYQDDSDSEPLVSGVPPYCRFGLARSAGTGLNITNQPLTMQENLGYSKFGIIYSALGESSCSNQNHVAPSYSKVTSPKFIHSGNNAVTFIGQSFVPKMQLKAVKEQVFNDSDLFNNKNSSTKEKPVSAPNKPLANNSYVSFSQALSDVANSTTAPLNNPPPASNVTVSNSYVPSATLGTPDKVEIKPNFSKQPSANPSLPKPSGYVSFQDAKVISLHDSHSNSVDVSEAGSTNLMPLPKQICSNSDLSENRNLIDDNCLMGASNTELPSFEEGETELMPFSDSLSVSDVDISAKEPVQVDESTSDQPLPHSFDQLSPESLMQQPVSVSDIVLIQPAHKSETGPNSMQLKNSPLVAVKHPPNGYVTWTELLGPRPSESTINPSIEHV